jgi:hypothetical protein
MQNKEKKNVKRSAVIPVAHAYGGVCYVTENAELLVNIKQIDIWIEKGRLKTLERTSFVVDQYSKIIYGDCTNAKYLPGNIQIIEQLEPPILSDPEYGLVWNDSHTQILRNKEGCAIYRYSTYNPSSKWEPTGEIDYFLK